jgi:hypothetical protein
MGRTVLIIILVIGFGAAGGFAYFQTRNLQDLQTNSTEVVAALEASGTQAVGFGMASETAFADSAYSTSTQAAQAFGDAAATSTEAAMISAANAENAAATSSQVAENFAATSSQAAENFAANSSQAAEEARATGTELADYSNATGTALANSVNSSGTESAENFNHLVASQAAFSTESANTINNQIATASSAAETANNQQATMQAQNLLLSGTLEASGWTGEGVFGESAVLPDGFESYEGDGYEIALPESFEGADLHDNPRSFYARLDRLGFDVTSDTLREQDENFLFFAIDTELVNAVPRATVSIVRDTPSIETNLEDYLGGAYVALEGNAALVISDVLPMNGQAVGRSIVEQSFEGASVRQMQYVFQVENTFYVLTFTSPVSEFVAMRPVLERSAGTFRLRD